MASIIEYQWIKIFKDSDGIEKFIPQFRLDGTQQFWSDTEDVKMTKLLITPISPELAANMQQHKIPGVSVPLPSWSFAVKPNDKVKAYWDNEIQLTSHYVCKTCGAQWQHTDSSKWAQCPECGQMDEWHCNRCGRIIENSLVKRNERGEVLCPHCEIPYGLRRTRYLERVQDVIENTDYVIEFQDRFKITIRQNMVEVE